jgi:hypothetical protein
MAKKKKVTKEPPKVKKTKYLVETGHNFGFGFMPPGSYINLGETAAEHYKYYLKQI